MILYVKLPLLLLRLSTIYFLDRTIYLTHCKWPTRHEALDRFTTVWLVEQLILLNECFCSDFLLEKSILFDTSFCPRLADVEFAVLLKIFKTQNLPLFMIFHSNRRINMYFQVYKVSDFIYSEFRQWFEMIKIFLEKKIW